MEEDRKNMLHDCIGEAVDVAEHLVNDSQNVLSILQTVQANLEDGEYKKAEEILDALDNSDNAFDIQDVIQSADTIDECYNQISEEVDDEREEEEEDKVAEAEKKGEVEDVE